MSKNQSSSDSSFMKTFNKLLSESDQLRRQFSEILRRQLAAENDFYYDFVTKMLRRNKQLKENLHNSLPLDKKRKDLLEDKDKFTKTRLMRHIELEKHRVI